MIQQAVILAAGHGTRLGPLTKDRPKSMLPVLGKPMMARVMDRLRVARRPPLLQDLVANV